MTLILRAVSLNDHPLTQPITAQFDSRGGTIGRADHNTLALPDPERHISRQQAEIRAEAGGFQILNIGSANPISVGGQPVAQGQSVPLRHGEQVRIGGYLLEVSEEALDPQEAATLVRRPPDMGGSRPMTSPGGAAGLGALGMSPSGSNPFADLLGAPAPARQPAGAAGAHASAPSPFAQPYATAPAAPAQQSAARLPDDFDPFAPPPSSRPAAAPASADPFAGLGGSTGHDPFAAPAGQGRASAGHDPFAPAASSHPGDPFAGLAPAAAGRDPFADLSPSSSRDPFADLAPAPSGDGFGASAGARSSEPWADLMPAAPASSLDDMFGLGGSNAADPLAGFMAGATRGAGGAVEGLPADPLALFGSTPAPAAEAAASAMSDHTPVLQSSFRPPDVRRPRPATEVPEATAPAIPQASDAGAAGLPSDLPLGLPPDLTLAETPMRPEAAGGSFQTPAPTLPLPAAAIPDAVLADAAIAAPPQAMAAAVPPRAVQEAASAAAGVAAMGASSPAASLPARPTPGMSTAPAQSGPTADTAALWRAFCEGAGLRCDPAQPLTPELMKTLGKVMHSAVDGTLRMMAVRAATKHELRAQVTVIRSRDNNPLKFSPDAESALEQLLQPPVRGFLPGPAAMSDAMHDLVGHTIGSMAGTRAALEGVLARFQPAALESKLTSRSMLDSVLTMNRKAKLWELYLQHFESIREEAQEDFHTLFGKAFLEAYEDQLERLNHRQSAA